MSTNTATRITKVHARLLVDLDIRTLRGPRHFAAGTVHTIVAMDAHGALLRMAGTTAEVQVSYDEASPVEWDADECMWVEA